MNIFGKFIIILTFFDFRLVYKHIKNYGRKQKLTKRPFLEDVTKEDFDLMNTGTVLKSRDKKFMVIKRFWGITEVLCKVTKKDGRWMYVCYNNIPLGKIFGESPNAYDNTISPDKYAGGHFHKKINELLRTTSLEPLMIILKKPESNEKRCLLLSSKTSIWDEDEYVSSFIIPAGIAHMVINDTNRQITLSVITSGQHEDDDVYPCPF